MDLKALVIDKSHGWAVFLDIYVLDADGALLDVCLLAAVAALLGLHLPHVEVNDQGQVMQLPKTHPYSLKKCSCSQNMTVNLCTCIHGPCTHIGTEPLRVNRLEVQMQSFISGCRW